MVMAFLVRGKEDDDERNGRGRETSAPSEEEEEREEEEEIVVSDVKEKRKSVAMRRIWAYVKGTKEEEREKDATSTTKTSSGGGNAAEEVDESQRQGGRRWSGSGHRSTYTISIAWKEGVQQMRNVAMSLRQCVLFIVNAVISQPFILAVLGIANLHFYFALRTYVRKFHGIEDDLKLVRLHSEQAFYYSYYNDLVRAPDFVGGIREFIKDSRSEHPDTINALQRFNIAPEFVIGIVYRQINAIRSMLGIQYFNYPFGFYCFIVFGLHALQVVFIMTLTATLLGSNVDSRAGTLSVTLHSNYNMYAAVIAGIWLLGNFDNVSRVGMVSLRENFALPFLWLQILCIVTALKAATKSTSDTQANRGSDDDDTRNTTSGMDFQITCLLFIASVGFLVAWQLSPFIVLTQILALMSSELFTAILTPPERLVSLGDAFLHTHRSIVAVLICAFAVTTCVQFGNRMLLASQAVHIALAYEASHIVFGYTHDEWRRLKQRTIVKARDSVKDESTDLANHKSGSAVPSMHARSQIMWRLVLAAPLYVLIRKLIFALLFAKNEAENGDASHIWGLLLGIIYKLNNNSAPFFALSGRAMQRGDGMEGIGAWLTQYFRDVSERFEVKIYLKESVFLPTPPKVWNELLSTGASTALLPLLMVFYFLLQEMWIGTLRKSGTANKRSTKAAEGPDANGHATRASSPSRSNGHPTAERGRTKRNVVILLEPDLVYMAVQGAAFLILGALIRRLMVFSMPIIAILVASAPVVVAAILTKLIEAFQNRAIETHPIESAPAKSSSTRGTHPSSSIKSSKKQKHNAASSTTSTGAAATTPGVSTSLDAHLVGRQEPKAAVATRASSFVHSRAQLGYDSVLGSIMIGVKSVIFTIVILLATGKNISKKLSAESLRPNALTNVELDTLNMIRWMRTYTTVASSEGGDMSTITVASDMTVTSHVRALIPSAHVTNHPHFEGENARARTRQVYKFFGCGSNKDILAALQDTGADLLIVNHGPAFKSTPPQCAVLNDGRPGNSDACSDETALSIEMFPVRCMWPANEGFNMLYHDRTYTILQIRPLHARPSILAIERETLDTQKCSVASTSETQDASTAKRTNSEVHDNPYVLSHSGFIKYFTSCMQTDKNCIENVLHLCDMWESGLGAKPIYMSWNDHHEFSIVRVSQMYATAIHFFDAAADGFAGYNINMSSRSVVTMMRNNAINTLMQLPVLIYEFAEFLNYGKQDYKLAEVYYREAIRKHEKNVQFRLGYAKFLYYSIISVDEAEQQFRKATTMIDDGVAETTKDIMRFVYHLQDGTPLDISISDIYTDDEFDWRTIFADVYCEYGTFLLKSVDRRLEGKNMSGDKRVRLASSMYGKSYELDKYTNCLREMYSLIKKYRAWDYE